MAQVIGDVLADRDDKGSITTRPMAGRTVTGFEAFDRSGQQFVSLMSGGKAQKFFPRVWAGESSTSEDTDAAIFTIDGSLDELWQYVRPSVDNINGLLVGIEAWCKEASLDDFEAYGTANTAASHLSSAVGSIAKDGATEGTLTDAGVTFVDPTHVGMVICIFSGGGQIEGFYLVDSFVDANNVILTHLDGS